MPIDKAETFILRVCDKTAAGEITWEKTANEGLLQATVAKYVIRFWPEGPDGSETYHISVRDANGSLLDSFNDEQFDAPGESQLEGSMYRKMQAAYLKAKRQALGVDKALDELLKELG